MWFLMWSLTNCDFCHGFPWFLGKHTRFPKVSYPLAWLRMQLIIKSYHKFYIHNSITLHSPRSSTHHLFLSSLLTCLSRDLSLLPLQLPLVGKLTHDGVAATGKIELHRLPHYKCDSIMIRYIIRTGNILMLHMHSFISTSLEPHLATYPLFTMR